MKKRNKKFDFDILVEVVAYLVTIGVFLVFVIGIFLKCNG